MEDQRECYIIALVTGNSKALYVNLKLIHLFIRLFTISIWYFILCASTILILSNVKEQTVMLKTVSVLSRYFPTKHDVDIQK